MYDMAFTEHTLRQQVRKVDFLNFRQLRVDDELDKEIGRALAFIADPAPGLALLKTQSIGRAKVRRFDDYYLVLSLRKLNANIRHCAQLRVHARDAIAASLRGVLSESVPFRIYKVDVRRFFESVSLLQTARALKRIGLEQSHTARLVKSVVSAHLQQGGQGLPRGLAISGTLSDLVMSEFDAKAEDRAEVFFYRRYVDDITVVTSGEEDPSSFVAGLTAQLPGGLELKVRKTQVRDAQSLPKKVSGNLNPRIEMIEYLGYSFQFDAENLPVLPCGHRKVRIDIAGKKVKKIKTRIVRALMDFISTRDFRLLDDRLRHLTSNLSMIDRSSGLRRLVGIHFNYPFVDANDSSALVELDRFLMNALSSSKGRVYSRLAGLLTPHQRVQLSRHSFVKGAKRKRFFQMGLRKLGKVQRCWKYA